MPSLGDPFRDAALESSVGALGKPGVDGGLSSFRTTAGASALAVGARLSAVSTWTLASSPTAHASLLVKLRLGATAATG
jgi:hypothetical protein